MKGEQVQPHEHSYDPFLNGNSRGHLEIDGCDAVELAAEFGTPLWVISERTIRANYRRLHEAFAREYGRTTIVYASKANPQPSVIRIAKLEGALVDAVTMGHIQLVLAAGYSPGDVIFNGNSKTREELEWALAHHVRSINVDSLDEMKTIADLQSVEAAPVSVCLRLAVDETRFESDDSEFASQWRGSKFGMDPTDAIEAARIAKDHRALVFEGLHHHFGWPAYGIPYEPDLDLMRHRRSVEQVMEFAVRLKDEVGVPVSVLNLGGGFRKARPEGFGPGRIAQAPSADDYARAIASEVGRLADRYDLGEPELRIEPGGYLVADAVVLLATVGLRKTRRAAETTIEWVFVENTSAYHFVRRLMFGFDHHVVAANKLQAEPEETVSIAGPICADDHLALDVRLPRLERGDLLAFLDQGAYCEAVTSDYCAVPIPPSVLARDGRAEVSRHRETPEDLLGRFSIPEWLSAPVPQEATA